MVEIHLTAIMQVAEHRNTAQGRQYDQYKLDKRTVKRDDLCNIVLCIFQHICSRACVVRFCRKLELHLIILLDGKDRQQQTGQTAQHAQCNRPHAACHVVPHQGLKGEVF